MQRKNLRKKARYYVSLKNLFNVIRSRYLSHYRGEINRVYTTQVYNIEKKSRHFDTKNSQRVSNCNSDEFKSIIAEEKTVISALNSVHDINSNAKSMRAKMFYESLLSKTESGSSKELIERFVSSQKLGDSLRGHQNLSESRVAQLRLENLELTKTWSEIQFAIGLRVNEGYKIESDEKDSRNLEQILEKVGLSMVHEARLSLKSNSLINNAKAGVQHIVKYLDSNSKLLKNIPSSTPPTVSSDNDIIKALAWCEERVIAVNEALVLDASKPAGTDDSKPLPHRTAGLRRPRGQGGLSKPLPHKTAVLWRRDPLG